MGIFDNQTKEGSFDYEDVYRVKFDYPSAFEKINFFYPRHGLEIGRNGILLFKVQLVERIERYGNGDSKPIEYFVQDWNTNNCNRTPTTSNSKTSRYETTIYEFGGNCDNVDSTVDLSYMHTLSFLSFSNRVSQANIDTRNVLIKMDGDMNNYLLLVTYYDTPEMRRIMDRVVESIEFERLI